jgi:hypothetical protein
MNTLKVEIKKDPIAILEEKFPALSIKYLIIEEVEKIRNEKLPR